MLLSVQYRTGKESITLVQLQIASKYLFYKNLTL
jgi:hypothetical protein